MIQFSDKKILILGDIMLDQYWLGDSKRISPEAPVPVVKVNDAYERLGGAANVALNIKTLGGTPFLMGVVGQDDAGEIIQQCMTQHGIESHLVVDSDKPSITKLRVNCKNQQLIRIDLEDTYRLSLTQAFLEIFTRNLIESDLLVISDYGKGTVKDAQTFIEIAQQIGKRVLIDPKGTDATKYSGATFFTPNTSEFESFCGQFKTEEELHGKALQFLDTHSINCMVLTRGAQGMSIFQKDVSPKHLGTFAREVYDVTGAGDTVIATLALGVISEFSIDKAVSLANTAAGLVVGKVGTSSVTIEELNHAMIHSEYGNVVTDKTLINQVAHYKRNNQKIVFTNGCFDILHAGHITYLREAKALGDVLIVAVNTDASVTKLKGEARPINCLEDRMLLLSELQCVDLVCSFHDDTPERLIEMILPDILVKGGDYTDIHALPGAISVLDNGGHVEILSLKEGLSTTKTLQKMNHAHIAQE